jgi:ATP-binding cassette subfamily C protein
MPTMTSYVAAGDVPNERTWTLALRLLRQYKGRTFLVVALSILSGLAEGVSVVTLLPLLGIAAGISVDGMPGFASAVEDALRLVGLEPTIGVLLVIIAGGMLAKAVLKLLAMWQAGAAAAQVAADLRLVLIENLMQARWGYFVQQPTGRMTNAVSSEAQRASQVFSKTCHLIAASIQVAVYIGVAFLVSWQIALLALALGGVMVWSLSGLVRASRRAGERQTVLLRSLIARLSDALYTIKPLKAMGREYSLRPLLEQETREVNTAQRREIVNKAAVDSFHEPIVTAFVAITIYVLLVVMGVPFGEILFMSFVFYRTIMNVGMLQRQLQALVVVQSALASIGQAIDNAGAAVERIDGGEPPPPLQRGIRFQNVAFSYGNELILDDVTADVPAGAITAIVGPSGIGKTTFADLVAGLYLPDQGEILIDETPLLAIDLSAWRQQIGYVPQESVLFHDTVYENVCMSDHHLSEEDVEKALRAADAWMFVASLPNGMHTVVGEHGLRLSGGQRQRLAIARALVHQPELLVLDEATTALDPATEGEILTTLAGLRDSVTILAISHQPGVLRIADHVIHMGHASDVEAMSSGSPYEPSSASQGRP